MKKLNLSLDFFFVVQASSETLQCPRCSASVNANPGVCSNCGENVYQCHKCRFSAFFFVSTFNFNLISRQTIIPHYSYLDFLFPFACLAVCSLRFFYSLVFVAVVVVVFVIFVVVIVVFEV